MRRLRLLGDQSQPAKDPRDVCVDSERVPIQRVCHDTPSGLLTNTGEGNEESFCLSVLHLMEVLQCQIIIVSNRANTPPKVVRPDPSE